MKISAVVPDELGVTLEERPRRRPDLASYMRIEERELERGRPELGTSVSYDGRLP